ncbi:glycoside hydrolase family protein [Olivibacter domesticus]|uniref:Glycosyl hydrolases family 43 n=1 Tax=Olivibacter domesticus TaxID=407022 RepID=A0A1H7Z7Y0_OLID1|nr:hypothetical protein [Olivibacter domesticus]SEM54530.1 hypothetical protein SAMN05661044_05462 [Olivibacter domesticus]
MKKRISSIYYLIAIVVMSITSSTYVCSQTFAKKSNEKTQKKSLKRIADHKGPVIGPNHSDVLSSKNRAGFETGQVVKIDGVYHMFINEMFERPHRDMRIAYWTSRDAINWKRQSTVVESIPGRSPSNPRSEVWVTAVEFNEDENAWNIFYVAYRAGAKEKGEIEGNDYAGRIWRAKSVITGREGIAGPYADMGIVLQPDENSQSWEGQQAVASFNPYKVGNRWYAFYEGHNHVPRGDWPTGMATASKLDGPWTRMPEGHNPVPLTAVFNENAQVTELKDGSYLTVFDSFGDQEIGYSLSEDGIHWNHETRIKVQSEKNLWGDPGDHAMRTPLCAIEEEDGTFTVIYTALITINGKKFYAVGKCTLAWE